MVVEIADDRAGVAGAMLGKIIDIMHDPEVGWIVYKGKVVGLSMDYPGEDVE